MILVLDDEELDIMRTALREYCMSVRQLARPYCTGLSPVGIDLCVTRMHIELLMDRLDHGGHSVPIQPRRKLERINPPENRPAWVATRAA